MLDGICNLKMVPNLIQTVSPPRNLFSLMQIVRISEEINIIIRSHLYLVIVNSTDKSANKKEKFGGAYGTILAIHSHILNFRYECINTSICDREKVNNIYLLFEIRSENSSFSLLSIEWNMCL